MALPETTHVKAKEDVMSRILDGEAVLLELGSGTYYGLNETGSELWSLIKDGATVQQLRQHMCEHFEVDEATVTSDVAALIQDLRERGLVDVS